MVCFVVEYRSSRYVVAASSPFLGNSATEIFRKILRNI